VKKLLIIGCGSIGQRHAENASKYSHVGVLDMNVDLTQAVAASINGRPFQTLEKALAWKPDGIVVATPHRSHVPLVLQTLNANADIMIEKPISHDLASVDQLLEATKEKSNKLFVVCNMRFHPAIRLIKEHLFDIGQAYFSRVYYGNYLPNMRPNRDYREFYAGKRESGGGVVLDATHEVDYLRWFFGDVEAVSCNATQCSKLDIDVEDYATITLKHTNGVYSEIHLDYLQQCKRRGCEIVGEKGTLVWASEGKHPEICTVRLFLKETGRWKELYHSNNENLNKPYELLMGSFIKSLAHDVDILASAEDGLATLRINLAALQSAREERMIYIK